MRNTTTMLSILCGLALATGACGQSLCDAIAESPLVVIASHRGVRPVGNDYFVHTIAIERTLRGQAQETVQVLEWKKLSFHQRPQPGARGMLWCLRPLPPAETARMGLPSRYQDNLYRTSQRRSSHVPASDDVQALAGIVLEAEEGVRAKDLMPRLLSLALQGSDPARREATALLAARPALLGTLDALDLARISQRASAETVDIDYRIALATICAERKMTGLVDALTLSLQDIDDARMGPALGRLARTVHGDDATPRLLTKLRGERNARVRRHLLLAIGATSSDAALDALLRMRGLDPDDQAVEAALRQHGSRRAMEAVLRKPR